MDEWLARVLDAHGGLDRWSGVQSLTARVSIALDAHRQHIVFAPFTAPDRRSVFDVGPERIVVQGADGAVVERRDNPRASFAGFDASSSLPQWRHDNLPQCGTLNVGHLDVPLMPHSGLGRRTRSWAIGPRLRRESLATE